MKFGGGTAHFLMTVDEYAHKCKYGKGNIAIIGLNKKDILLRHFHDNE